LSIVLCEYYEVWEADHTVVEDVCVRVPVGGSWFSLVVVIGTV